MLKDSICRIETKNEIFFCTMNPLLMTIKEVDSYLDGKPHQPLIGLDENIIAINTKSRTWEIIPYVDITKVLSTKRRKH